jgi:hypothetical protein
MALGKEGNGAKKIARVALADRTLSLVVPASMQRVDLDLFRTMGTAICLAAGSITEFARSWPDVAPAMLALAIAPAFRACAPIAPAGQPWHGEG